ncbi:MAG: SycD/LcrH family type III secretion system chaperone [Kiritimatiellae bacterium]|nr:SycD/LcrH family type III secretion system chaperone [Kiritimatiellia bacterium]
MDSKTITNDEIAEAARKFIASEASLAELKGISHDELEAVYSLGFNYYRTGKYEEAAKLFKFLVLFDHLNAKYWMAIGAVQQVSKDYEGAVASYAYASFLDISNPKPQYHAAECFLAMGDKVNARSAIDALEMYSPKDTELGRTYREKAAALKKLAAGEETGEKA